MAKRKYRRWTRDQKRRILQEVEDARTDSWGAVKAVLDSYGLGPSHLQAWELELARSPAED